MPFAAAQHAPFFAANPRPIWVDGTARLLGAIRFDTGRTAGWPFA